MKILNFLVFLLIVGCASTTRNENKDLTKISNKDFNKASSKQYNRQKDFFKPKEKSSFVLADEAVISSDDIEDLEVVQTPDKILSLCLSGDFKEAFKLVELNTDKFKTHPVYWNQVGTCFLLKKEYRKSLMYFNKALEFKSNYAPALNNIGVMYRKQGDDQKAQVAFEKAVKSSSYAKTPRYNLAQIYLEYGLSGNARKHLSVLLRESPDEVIYNSMAVSYLMESDYKKALAFYKKIRSSRFEEPSFGINYALTLYRLGRKDDARDIIDDIDIGEKSKYKKYLKRIKKRLGSL